MPKGYFLSAHRSPADPEKRAAYLELAGPAMLKAGGKVLASTSDIVAHEKGISQQTVLVEFETFEKAVAAYESEDYQKALKVDPNHPLTLFHLGVVFQDIFDFDSSIRYYNRAIHSNSNYIDPLFNLSFIHKDLGNYKVKNKNLIGLAETPNPIKIYFNFKIQEVQIPIEIPLTYRKTDRVIGCLLYTSPSPRDS